MSIDFQKILIDKVLIAQNDKYIKKRTHEKTKILPHITYFNHCI